MLEILTRKRPVQQRALPAELIPARTQPAATVDPGVAVISMQTVTAPAMTFARAAGPVPPSLGPTSQAYRTPETGGTQREALAEIAGCLTTRLTAGLGEFR